ncbi:MAG: carbamoyl-phosphate synthase large subunit [Pseudomonadota bacterium]
MPKRTDIQSIALIGAGPIVIGQACEFDYSGTQACRALRDLGYRVVLINANPATIMTDPQTADATYIEPVTPDFVAQVIEHEEPDALLPTMGGQTALNVALQLQREGRLGATELIGARAEVIERAEDRQKFRQTMEQIGLPTPRSIVVSADGRDPKDHAQRAVEAVGLPAIIRPSYTLGGRGGGIAFTLTELTQLIAEGMTASLDHTVLVEQSVLGWKEYELEVVRDSADNCIIVCSIENIDPMGVHTGDSITVAPAMTLTDKEYQLMRDAAIAILRAIGVDTGGSNVQFAVNPENGEMVVIEMNPRVSRSSALASKATGFPIAKIAASLAVGLTLDELRNDMTQVTPASFEPSIDYVVTKIPRFTFEKFPTSARRLTTSMRSVGEVMAIGATFAESLHKALQSLEQGLTGLNTPNGALEELLDVPTDKRLLAIAEGLRAGKTPAALAQQTRYDPWFIGQLAQLVALEQSLRTDGAVQDAQTWRTLKSHGFSDARIAELGQTITAAVRKARQKAGITPLYRRVDTCAGEFASQTSYLYSTYPAHKGASQCEARPTDQQKIIIVGSGCNRIGQGIEFDYCCVHAVQALREIGFETIMVNCNPETVSTDYDIADRLYLEPLTAESVRNIAELEAQNGTLVGLMLQFGGQTPINLAQDLADLPILGTPLEAIHRCEDRQQFADLIRGIGLHQPAGGIATSAAEAEEIAERIGYPVLLRPSFVLGGRAMEIVDSPIRLRAYIDQAVDVSQGTPLLVDHFLANAIEIDVDVVCDGRDSFIAAPIEHIEEAGIHSGDSACCIPTRSLSEDQVCEIKRQASLLAKEIGIVGLLNVQMALAENTIYILEANPRASRTVPFVAKATGIPIAKMAALVMSGLSLSEAHARMPVCTPVPWAVKEAVFPFTRFSGQIPALGPEMRSIGEGMGIGASFTQAFAKGQLGCDTPLLNRDGRALVRVDDQYADAMTDELAQLAKVMEVAGVSGSALQDITQENAQGDSQKATQEGLPALLRENIALVIDLPARQDAHNNPLRDLVVRSNIPYFSTLAGAKAAIQTIVDIDDPARLQVRSLQDYFASQDRPMKKTRIGKTKGA